MKSLREKQPPRVKGGKWTFVPDDPVKAKAAAMDDVRESLALGVAMSPGDKFHAGLAAIEQFYDYFPGDQQVPEGGCWIMVKESPSTEYTVPPMSFWFAEPWPMTYRHTIHRVKIVTRRGDLGILPHEYSLITDPETFYEFLGKGIDIHFFGDSQSGHGLPMEKVFYMQTRGIPKREAVGMILGSVKAHGVCWMETRPEIAASFGLEWPDKSILATGA